MKIGEVLFDARLIYFKDFMKLGFEFFGDGELALEIIRPEGIYVFEEKVDKVLRLHLPESADFNLEDLLEKNRVNLSDVHLNIGSDYIFLGRSLNNQAIHILREDSSQNNFLTNPIRMKISNYDQFIRELRYNN